jgi:hypothetical protein
LLDRFYQKLNSAFKGLGQSPLVLDWVIFEENHYGGWWNGLGLGWIMPAV